MPNELQKHGVDDGHLTNLRATAGAMGVDYDDAYACLVGLCERLPENRKGQAPLYWNELMQWCKDTIANEKINDQFTGQRVAGALAKAIGPAALEVPAKRLIGVKV